MKKYDPVIVGMRIRKQRMIMGLTQEEIAEKIGRSYKYYQDIERGTCGMSLNTMLDITKSLHASVDFLIYGNIGENIFSYDEEEELQAITNALGNCTKHQKRYVVELIKLFLKACGG